MRVGHGSTPMEGHYSKPTNEIAAVIVFVESKFTMVPDMGFKELVGSLTHLDIVFPTALRVLQMNYSLGLNGKAVRLPPAQLVSLDQGNLVDGGSQVTAACSWRTISPDSMVQRNG